MPFVQFRADFSVYFTDLALQSHDWTKGWNEKRALRVPANMKEIKARNHPQTQWRHVKDFFWKGGHWFVLTTFWVCFFLGGGGSSWSDILYLYLCQFVFVFFTKVCFLIGTFEAGEVVPSSAGKARQPYRSISSRRFNTEAKIKNAQTHTTKDVSGLLATTVS